VRIIKLSFSGSENPVSIDFQNRCRDVNESSSREKIALGIVEHEACLREAVSIFSSRQLLPC